MNPAYKPSEADFNTVKSMAACGFSEEIIASCLGTKGIAPKTLRKHFRRELKTSVPKANAAVGNALFKMATSGDCPAATIFWMKTRMRWRETQDVRFVDEDGKDRGMIDLSRMRASIMAAFDGQPDETRYAVSKRLLDLSRGDGPQKSPRAS
jgi:hypothetical protein